MGEDFNWDWFIGNLWERENAQGLRGIEGKGGYKEGRYHPYKAANGTDVGPGFDMAYQSEAFRKKANTEGFTKEELNDSIRQSYQKELPYIYEKIAKEGGNPSNVSNEVIAGLLDIYHTRKNGLYQEFPKLWKAVAAGDYEGMKRESRTGYYDDQKHRTPEHWHWDDGRWKYRKDTYFSKPPSEYIKEPEPLGVPTINYEDSEIRIPQPYQVKSEGGPIQKRKLWDELSLTEKSAMMKAAISQGYYDLPTIRQKYNEFAQGGGIHIKPSHRGRLTELKERTGKTEAELYNDGNPAHKKMVVFARNARKWKHAEGGPLSDEEIPTFGNLFRSGGNSGSFWQNLGLGAAKLLGIDNIFKGSEDDANYRQNLYNSVDPTNAAPSSAGDILDYALTVKRARGKEVLPYERKFIDATSDAAWAKRLGLPYDENALPANYDGSVRLPKSLEAEIPTDTTFLKNRISNNKKLLEHYKNTGASSYDRRMAINAGIKYDQAALDALRKTYATGEPVVINEGSHVNRRWIRNGIVQMDKTPLNVLHNYTIKYDKDKNEMQYQDLYDFNQFEDFIPGKPFTIKGHIKLK